MFSATFGTLPPVEPSNETFAEIGELCAAWAYLEAVTEATLWGILDADEKLGPLISARLDLRGRWMMILRHAPKKHTNTEIELLRDTNKDLTPVIRDRNIIVHGLVNAVMAFPAHMPPTLGTDVITKDFADPTFSRIPCWTIFRGADAGKSFPVSKAAAEIVRNNIVKITTRVENFNEQHSYRKFTLPAKQVETGWPVQI